MFGEDPGTHLRLTFCLEIASNPIHSTRAFSHAEHAGSFPSHCKSTINKITIRRVSIELNEREKVSVVKKDGEKRGDRPCSSYSDTSYTR